MMTITNHLAVFLSNNSHSQVLVQQLLSGNAKAPFTDFNGLKGVLFSTTTLQEFIVEEAKHQHTDVLTNTSRTLQSMSSGERKKVLLAYILLQQPDFIILDNPFDNLDVASQQLLLQQLVAISHHTTFIQFVNRQADQLSLTENSFYRPEDFTISITNNQGVKGIISHVQFFGSYYEIDVLVLGESIIVKTDIATVSKGDSVYINSSKSSFI